MKKDFINWLESEYWFTNIEKYPNKDFTKTYNEYRRDLRMVKNMAVEIVNEIDDIKEISKWKNTNNKYKFWTYLSYKRYKAEYNKKES